MPRPRKLPERPSLVELLASASDEDLADVRARIGRLESELEALRVVERAVDVRLHGRPVRKGGRKPKAEANGQAPLNRLPGVRGETTATYRMKAVEYLGRVKAAKPMVIANDCGIPKGSIVAVLDHEEFRRGVDGFVKLAT